MLLGAILKQRQIWLSLFIITTGILYSQAVPEVNSLGSVFYNEGESATYTVTYTPVNGGDVISWNFGDGNIVSGNGISHTYTNNGTYNISVTVTNNSGSGQNTGIAFISNLAPVVTLFTIPASGNEGQSLNFIGAGSDAGLDDILSFNWDFGDGNQSVEQHPAHIYTEPGLYDVSLSIRDHTGAIQTEMRQDLIRIFSQYMPGDLNFDGQNSVSDIVILVNIIIGEIAPTDAQYETADVNGDELINVQDLVSLINIILYN